jgi:hypothetical protein
MSQLPQPERFRLIALDLDGTLLTDEGRITEDDAAALRGFSAAGGLVTLASGRMTDNIRPFCSLLCIDGPTIAYNGAMVRDAAARGRAPIFSLPLPERFADLLIDYTREEHFHLNYYLDETLYARDIADLRKYADLYSAQTGAVYHFLPCLDSLRGSQPTKALIVTDRTVIGQPNPRHRDELYQVWQAKWGQQVTVMRTNPEYLEFFHREAGKGRALAELAGYYGIQQAETLTFGDNYNDVSMLEWSGCGVAVANATPEARAAADWVSPLDNNQSAVADAIRRLVRPPSG